MKKLHRKPIKPTNQKRKKVKPLILALFNYAPQLMANICDSDESVNSSTLSEKDKQREFFSELLLEQMETA